VLLGGFGAIAFRLVDVQVVNGDRYTSFGVSQRYQEITLPADRGSIFDRNGYDLAVSLPQQTVWANPSQIDHPLEVATALAGPLTLDPAATSNLAERLSRDAQFVYVARRIDDAVAGDPRPRAPRDRVPRGAGAHRAGRRPRAIGPRPGRRRQRRAVRARAEVRRRADR
jgi:stage V sporulation protein D (sporulation-specific penicillin-binding protein)